MHIITLVNHWNQPTVPIQEDEIASNDIMMCYYRSVGLHASGHNAIPSKVLRVYTEKTSLKSEPQYQPLPELLHMRKNKQKKHRNIDTEHSFCEKWVN